MSKRINGVVLIASIFVATNHFGEDFFSFQGDERGVKSSFLKNDKAWIGLTRFKSDERMRLIPTKKSKIKFIVRKSSNLWPERNPIANGVLLNYQNQHLYAWNTKENLSLIGNSNILSNQSDTFFLLKKEGRTLNLSRYWLKEESLFRLKQAKVIAGYFTLNIFSDEKAKNKKHKIPFRKFYFIDVLSLTKKGSIFLKVVPKICFFRVFNETKKQEELFVKKQYDFVQNSLLSAKTPLNEIFGVRDFLRLGKWYPKFRLDEYRISISCQSFLKHEDEFVFNVFFK